jgi:hypothetical protein
MSGDAIGLTDLGAAIVWEAGFVKDEPVRRALAELACDDFIVEYLAALGLTERGEAAAYRL